uniref:Transmembrane protein 88 n=1 Tax=Malurus cyaneus samueli TaxID=2593467 RepID=A0A8C5TZZ6_9PASS
MPPYDMDDRLLPGEPRSPCCCLAWSLLIATMNLLFFLLNLLLMLVIFTVVLLPTIVVVYFGFQCHSQVSPGLPSLLPEASKTQSPTIRA